MKILVVDDQEDGRVLLDRLLTARGHQVVTAESGRSARERARAEAPDLVLSDILMPHMDGYALCRDLKADPLLAPIPFVFYTATFLGPEEEKLGRDLGARGFLRKPFTPADLDRVLAQVASAPRDGAVKERDTALDQRYEEVLSNHLAAKVRELEAVERRLTTLMDNLPGMVYRCRNDRPWTLLFASDGAQAVTGYSPGALVDNRAVAFAELIHPQDRRRVRREVTAATAEGRLFSLRYRITHADGRTRWVWEQGREVRDADGEPVLEGYLTDVTAEQEQEERLREATTALVRAIALTVEKRDPYTAGHMQRVADIATAVAGEMGLDGLAVEGLRLGALVHDIGKIYIPAEILNRPGRLSETEFALIKTHPTVGWEILRDFEFPWPLADMILQHHERLDGSGYPHGLTGDGILPEARILAVADVAEAMTSHRPYRPALGAEPALAELRAGRGSRYDPAVVDALLALVARGELRLAGTPAD